MAGRDGGWRGSTGAEAPSKPVTKYLSNGATNPTHARYYWGGNICLKCALEHTRRQRPRPLQPASQGRLLQVGNVLRSGRFLNRGGVTSALLAVNVTYGLGSRRGRFFSTHNAHQA